MENDQDMAPDEKRVRDALKRLQDGMPDDARNRELIAKGIRIHGRININMRMVCREVSFSPTTVYKRFPWLQELLTQNDEDNAPPSVVVTVSDAETIAQQVAEITRLKKTITVLQAENHQLAQANIALDERIQGANLARQAAINAGRRRKADTSNNVTAIHRS